MMCAFWRRSAPLEPRLAASMRAGAAPALLVAPWSGFASGLCPSRSPLGAQRAPRPPAIDVLPHDQPIGACLRYAKTCVCYSILQSAPRQVRQALIRWLPQIGVPRGARPLAGGAEVAGHPCRRPRRAVALCWRKWASYACLDQPLIAKPVLSHLFSNCSRISDEIVKLPIFCALAAKSRKASASSNCGLSVANGSSSIRVASDVNVACLRILSP